MAELLIKYKFKGLPYIVADGKGGFYQLPHSSNNRFKPFRKLNLILNNGITDGYRINRKFISLIQLRKLSYLSVEVVHIDTEKANIPF